MNRICTNRKLQLFGICVLMLTLIFAAVYKPFLFDGQMYAYQDIGSDTIHQYLPRYTLETGLLRNGGGDGYNLQSGFGEYLSGLLTKYLSPANIAILLFGAEKLNIGLLAATYVKYCMICLFSLLYFLRLLKNERAAVIATLLWTFSGFSVLWGQHYQFLSAMVGFSACMYAFQSYLEEYKKWYLVVPLMPLLFSVNYYFSYNTVWFLLLYGVFYLLFQRKSVQYILKKVAVFVPLVLLSVGVSASYLLPSVVGFLNSPRAEHTATAFASVEWFYPMHTLLSFAARFLSSNLIGIANDFKGTYNYYETAVLSVSILFIFSVAFLLLGKYRRRTLSILLSCILLLCMPITSKLLCFADNTQRWTYLLCFLQTITIGAALTEFFNHANDNRRLVRTVLIGDGLLALLGVVLLWYHFYTGVSWLNKSACVMILILLLMYHIAFFLLWKNDHKFAILLSLIAVELTLGNYATVNHRNTITTEEWYSQLYHDGTEKVVQWIKEQDNSIYRINKTYYSVFVTDSMVQGYNGLGAYSSTNSAHISNLIEKWGYSSGLWMGIDGNDWLANDMLGVKYIISKSGEIPKSEGLQLIYDDGTYCVYQNMDWSGFGYLCYGEVADSSVASNTLRHQRALVLTHDYYRTGNNDAPAAQVAGIREIELLPYLTEGYDCQISKSGNGIAISGTGVDAQMYFTVPEIEGWNVVGVSAEMDTQTPSVAQIFMATQETGYSEEQSCATGYDAGSVSLLLESPCNQPVSVRFDPTVAEGQTLSVRSLRLHLIDPNQLQQQQEMQRKNAVRDLEQNGNTFTGAITNPSDADAMLCMPLIYSTFWRATVDGEPVEVVNVNGGITGFMIPAGEHTFALSYDDTIFTVAKGISWVSIALYVLLLIWWVKDPKRKAEMI